MGGRRAKVFVRGATAGVSLAWVYENIPRVHVRRKPPPRRKPTPCILSSVGFGVPAAELAQRKGAMQSA